MKKLIFILIFFLSINLSFAQGFRGVDTLALAKMDCKMVSEVIPPNTSIGVLDGTFGDPTPCLDKLISTGKVNAVRVHLLNGTCWRNNKCERGEPSPTDTKALALRARRYNAFFAQRGVMCYLSPVLEHDIKDRSKAEANINTVKQNAPNCAIVQSAFTGYRVPGILNEYHGNSASGDITSNDGNSLFDSNSPKYQNSGKVITFGWIHRFNFRVPGESVFVLPSKRTLAPSKDDFLQVFKLLQPEEKAPSRPPGVCRKVRKFEGIELSKTNADDHGTGDVRDNKPVYLLKNRTNRMSLIDVTGKTIGCTINQGEYTPNKKRTGIYRHYEGLCSKLTPIGLMQRARSEWLYIKDGSTCLMLNAIRRKPYFREK